MIRIWKFADAPSHLKLHPPSASDTGRAWVMEVPSSMSDEVDAILQSSLGSPTDISRDELPNGTIVFSGLYSIPSPAQASRGKAKRDAPPTQRVARPDTVGGM